MNRELSIGKLYHHTDTIGDGGERQIFSIPGGHPWGLEDADIFLVLEEEVHRRNKGLIFYKILIGDTKYELMYRQSSFHRWEEIKERVLNLKSAIFIK